MCLDSQNSLWMLVMATFPYNPGIGLLSNLKVLRGMLLVICSMLPVYDAGADYV